VVSHCAACFDLEILKPLLKYEGASPVNQETVSLTVPLDNSRKVSIGGLATIAFPQAKDSKGV